MSAPLTLALALAVDPFPWERGPHPSVEALLGTIARNDFRQQSEFFRSLTKLVGRKDLPPEFAELFAAGIIAGYDHGRAVALSSENKRYVAVSLGNTPISHPGGSAQQIILLSQKGKLLGRMMCNINSRYGGMLTEILKQPEKDGAQLVIRFQSNHPPSIWHNWHTITYADKDYTFWAREQDEPVNWSKEGLVRARIRQDRLEVIFPKLQQPDKK